MAASDMNRIKSKLFALNIRLAEVNSEVAAEQARVRHLENQLEDARLASLLGEDAGAPTEIGPELEKQRGRLQDRQRLQERIRRSQWETRVRYMIARRLQLHRAQQRAERRDDNEEGEGR